MDGIEGRIGREREEREEKEGRDGRERGFYNIFKNIFCPQSTV